MTTATSVNSLTWRNKGRGQRYWTSTSRVTRSRPEPRGLVRGQQRAFGAREEMQALLEAGRGRYSGFFLHQSLLLAEPCRSPADNEFGECSLQSSVIRSRKGIGKQNLSEQTGTWLSQAVSFGIRGADGTSLVLLCESRSLTCILAQTGYLPMSIWFFPWFIFVYFPTYPICNFPPSEWYLATEGNSTWTGLRSKDFYLLIYFDS